MKLWLLPLVIFACFLLVGCPSYSLHPLYTDQDAVVVPALEGTWIDPSSDPKEKTTFQTTFQKSGDHGYTMIVDEAGTKLIQTYDIRLIRLGNQLFMDLAWSDQTLNGANLDPPIGAFIAHEILKVEISEDDLAYATLEDDAIKKQGRATGENLLEYRTSDNGALLVTASTDGLRRYVAAHAGDAFSSFEHLKKKREQPAK